MICGLIMGTLAIITMNVNAMFNTGWLVRTLTITYIVIYIKVIIRMLTTLKQLIKNTIL